MKQDAGPALEAKARKGDLILIETVTRNSYSVAARMEAKAAGRELSQEDTTYTFGVVASATREGYVKSWSSVGYGDELVSTYAMPIGTKERRWVVGQKDIDVPAAMKAAKAHHWDGHPGQPQPFDSLKEATDTVRPFRITH
jgi:hypothetical protein